MKFQINPSSGSSAEYVDIRMDMMKVIGDFCGCMNTHKTDTHIKRIRLPSVMTCSR